MTQQGFLQQFGGDWTEIKLQKVEKYLRAYAQIMKNRNFIYAYIDAFAGTGYRTIKQEDKNNLLLPLFEEDSQKFRDGSARIALQITPRFSKYIFIDKDPEHSIELKSLKEEFSHLSNDIDVVGGEANEYLKDLCSKDWIKHNRRAVLFLDPFGMQVEWQTIEAIAETKAIDLWLLFPLGVAVNRMLRKDAQIPKKWQQRLTTLFGTTAWMDAFYETKIEQTLFGERISTSKVDDPFNSISHYFVERLKTIFAGVADNPLPLYNSKNNPLYLLCFASGNPKGSKTAIKIAQHILKG